MTWSNIELHKIAEADDLHISPFREHGMTHGTSTWIWSVAVDDALYVRAYNRQDSRLVPGRGAPESGAHRCRRRDEGSYLRARPRTVNDGIDQAYRAKYCGSPYLRPMISPHASLVKVMPRVVNA
jgi:hypothetical protein